MADNYELLIVDSESLIMTKVLIATPIKKDVKIDVRTIMFLQEEVSHYAGQGWKWAVRIGMPVESARNDMIREMQEGDYTHIYFLDADTIPPKDTIGRLLAHDKDVVAGITPVWLNERCWNYQIEKDVQVLANKPPTEIFKAMRIGGTTILVKREVLEKLKSPYFYTDKYNGKYITDDYYFCDKLHDSGFELWIDPTIVCGHMNYVNLLDMYFKEFNDGSDSR